MTTTDLDTPRTARALIRKLAPGWAHRLTRGRGTTEVSYRGTVDGVGRNLAATVPCTSWAVRLRNPAAGLGAFACWAKPDHYPDGAPTTAKPPTCMAWRTDEAGRIADWPRKVTSTWLADLVAGMTPAEADRAEQQRAAARSAKRSAAA